MDSGILLNRTKLLRLSPGKEQSRIMFGFWNYLIFLQSKGNRLHSVVVIFVKLMLEDIFRDIFTRIFRTRVESLCFTDQFQRLDTFPLLKKYTISGWVWSISRRFFCSWVVRVKINFNCFMVIPVFLIIIN